MKKILFITLMSLVACGKNEDACKKTDPELAKEGFVVVNAGQSNERWQDLSGEGYMESHGMSGMQRVRTRDYEAANGTVRDNAGRLFSKYSDKTTYILEGKASSSTKFIYSDIFACRDR